MFNSWRLALNSILAFNAPNEIQLSGHLGSFVTLDHSALMGGEEEIEIDQDGQAQILNGVQFVDPMFVDHDSADYNLLTGSPCIDAGTRFFVWERDTVILYTGDHFIGDYPDLGFIEYDPANSIRENDLLIPEKISLIQIYPNPFNAAANIRFYQSAAGIINISICDNSGRMVSAIYAGYADQGWRSLNWNPDGLPAGTYFCRIDAGEVSGVERIVLLR